MKEFLKKHIINSRGKRNSKKLLVIESDDWGSIRIPNKEVQDYLVNAKLIKPTDPFSAFDCLESTKDFDTLKRGIEQMFIYPQFHAREHLNSMEWIKRLQIGDERFLQAFNVNCFAIDDQTKGNSRANLMASYDYQTNEELFFLQESIKEGLQLFEKTFGFISRTTITPCYVWNDSVEEVFSKYGVESIQSSYVQQKNIEGKHIRIWKKMGASNRFNQKYFVRNVLFEPSLNKNVNWVDKALESIEIALFWGKPAIIGSHRINYVGGLSTENRESTLKQLDDLLKQIIKKWPDIQFVNSEQLLKEYS